ncbi:MAG: molybdopterin molybdotransferase MoeA, partial [Acidimicrobiia bacterium]|nr:molybdopterin molybdotransferase MoeA [Acidimicrobiia bacterium]
MRPLAEAQRDVLVTVPLIEVVNVPLDQAAGLVLASPVTAPHDVPPFTNSAMDGYAVIAADVRNPPVELTVTEDVAAGHVASGTVTTGTAIKIMTGAPVPAGADSVVKVEDTEPGPGRVTILAAVEEGTAVRPAGGDLAAGAAVFDAGTRLTARHLAVLASLGVASPTVRRRPRVALMSTGDEVRPPETADLSPGQIRDTNRPLLSRVLAELGVVVLDLGIIRDDEALLRSTVARAAAEADAIFTSGGVSM